MLKENEIYYNKQNQPFVVIDRFFSNGRSRASVKFLETSTIATFRLDTVNNGEIKDRYAKESYWI